MRRPFTIGFTLFAAVLCLVHYVWHDADSIYMFFYALSIPAWFAPAFTTVSIVAIYILTIISYAIIGYVIDYAIALGRRRGSV